MVKKFKALPHVNQSNSYGFICELVAAATTDRCDTDSDTATVLNTATVPRDATGSSSSSTLEIGEPVAKGHKQHFMI